MMATAREMVWSGPRDGGGEKKPVFPTFSWCGLPVENLREFTVKTLCADWQAPDPVRSFEEGGSAGLVHSGRFVFPRPHGRRQPLRPACDAGHAGDG